MPRPALYSDDDILDAARGLVLSVGARAATIDGIVAASGAPKGSIYYRFATVDDLLAAMWLRAVRRSQDGFLAALDGPDPVEAAIAGGLAIHDFAREYPADARLLASLRQADLVGAVTDPELKSRLAGINVPLGEGLASLARRLYGRRSRSAIDRLALAIVDLPQGAIRRHLVAGGAVPAGVRQPLEAAMRAALDA